jgi:hypothetical protein
VSNLWFGRRRRTHERYLNNLVRVSCSLVLSKMLQPRREYERFQKTPICLWRHFPTEVHAVSTKLLLQNSEGFLGMGVVVSPVPKCGNRRRYLFSPLTEKVWSQTSYYERNAIRRLGHKRDSLRIYLQLAGHMFC